MTATQTGLFAPPVRAVEGSWTSRRYQIDCADAVFRQWEKVRATVAIMATGTGKTRTAALGVIARILRENPRARVLAVAHLNTLTKALREELGKMLGEPVALEQGKHQWTSERVCVASIPTLYNAKRLSFIAPMVTHVVYDEVHHASGTENTKVLDAMPKAKVLGLTATPRRHDNVSLRSAGFESAAYEYPISTIVRPSGYAVEGAIQQGYLVPVLMAPARIAGLEFGHLKRKDFTDGRVGEIIGGTSILRSICESVIKLAEARVTISFWPTVKVSYLAAALFNELRPGYARAIDCKMEAGGGDAALRLKNQAIDDFKAGKYQHACNVGVLAEGFDYPAIACVVNAAPTESLPAYLQRIGRGTRNVCKVDDYGTAAERKAAIAASKKPNLLIIDVVGSHGKFNLVNAVDALGGDVDPEEAEAAEKAAEEGKLSVDEAVALGKAEVARRRKEHAEKLARAKPVEISFGDKVNPFEVFGMPTPTVQPGAQPERPATPELVKYLKDAGIDVPAETTHDVALQLRRQVDMRKRKHLASFKQIKQLARVDVNARSMYSKNASKIIAHLMNDASLAGRDIWNWRKLSKDEVGRIIKGET